jgi:hypothetical protein
MILVVWLFGCLVVWLFGSRVSGLLGPSEGHWGSPHRSCGDQWAGGVVVWWASGSSIEPVLRAAISPRQELREINFN